MGIKINFKTDSVEWNTGSDGSGFWSATGWAEAHKCDGTWLTHVWCCGTSADNVWEATADGAIRAAKAVDGMVAMAAGMGHRLESFSVNGIPSTKRHRDGRPMVLWTQIEEAFGEMAAAAREHARMDAAAAAMAAA